MEYFSASPKADIKSSTISCHCHSVFHSFLSGDSKQDAATATAHSKRLILWLKKRKLLETALSTIWGNTDGCVEQYRCAFTLYLMSVMSKCYSIIIDRGISAPGHRK